MKHLPNIVAAHYRQFAMIDDVRVLAQLCDVEEMQQFAKDAKHLSSVCDFAWRQDAPRDPYRSV